MHEAQVGHLAQAEARGELVAHEPGRALERHERALALLALREQALQGLAHAAGFVRRQLAPRLGLREVPELRFVLDTSIERGARVEEILRKIERGETVEEADGEEA